MTGNRRPAVPFNVDSFAGPWMMLGAAVSFVVASSFGVGWSVGTCLRGVFVAAVVIAAVMAGSKQAP